MSGVGPSDHLCLCYQGDEERLAASIPFITDGLERGEQVVWLAEAQSRSPVLDALLAGPGSLVQGALDGGALAVFPAEQVYLPDGRFDAARVLAWLRAAAQRATESGYSGLRLLGELGGFASLPPGSDQLASYEAELTRLGAAAETDLTICCSYDLPRFSPRALLDAVETHPRVVVGGTVCVNHAWAPTEQVLRPDWSGSAEEALWLLHTLRRTQLIQDRQQERDHERRVFWQRLFDQQEMERRSFVRDLHDDLGQILAALQLRLQSAEPGDPGRPSGADAREEADGQLPDPVTLLGDAMQAVRTLAAELRPPVLDDLGLAAALRSHARHQGRRGGWQPEVDVAAIEDVALPRILETACFRVAQEALTNVVRHAGAKRVRLRVDLGGEPPRLELLVADDGRGFDLDAARSLADEARGIGLRCMRERAALAGGELMIESRQRGPSPDGDGAGAGAHEDGRAVGTVLRVQFPLPPEGQR